MPETTSPGTIADSIEDGTAAAAVLFMELDGDGDGLLTEDDVRRAFAAGRLRLAPPSALQRLEVVVYGSRCVAGFWRAKDPADDIDEPWGRCVRLIYKV